MPISIKWFPPSSVQTIVGKKIIYIDPAYLRTYFTKHPKKIEFSKNKLKAPSEVKALILQIGEIYSV